MYKNGDTINGSVLEYLYETFPVPFFEKTKKYEVGTILNTKVRFRTNATIIAVNDSKFTIVTDIGNVLEVTEKELKAWYKKPNAKRLSEEFDET